MPTGTPENLLGRVYGRLTVVGIAKHAGRRAWLCNCQCGATKVVATTNLKSGDITSCGCLRAELLPNMNLRHGGNRGGRRTKEYRAWAHIIGRCGNPGDKAYADYGGRGIKVCERWSASFESFLADMGVAPAGSTIERLDNDGDYAPGNCVWATRAAQVRNTRRTIKVDGVCLKDACAARGVSYAKVLQRIARGVPPELAFDMTPGAYAAKTKGTAT